MYYLLMPGLQERQALIRHLADSGICAPFHYVPLHTSDMGRRFGAREGDCPVTEDISNRLVRLPLYNGLSDAEQAEVIERVQSYSTQPRSMSVKVS
jgi:dTDP-4-amino-4,6-dideoxygalactose transaminase